MASQVKKMEGYDVVIAGGGPGGCVLAKDLTKAGKKVIIVEQGGNSTRGIGSPLGLYFGGHMEKAPFPKMFAETIEGHQVALGKGIGGGTYLYGGIAAFPDFKAFEDVGIDLKPYLEDAKRETWVEEVPDEFLGPNTKRMMDIAKELGFPFKKSIKHIKFSKCQYGCTKPTFGCPKGAKWMGKYAADEAEAHGAKLLIYTKVRDVIIEDGVAVGVNAKSVRGDQEYEIRGKAVVCCGGGKGSALMLMKSGLVEAGTRLSGDPCFTSYGLLPEGSKGMGVEHGSVIDFVDDERGILIANFITFSRFMWAMTVLPSGGLGEGIEAYRNYGRVAWMYIKIHDEGVGRILWDGSVSKTVTARDEEKMNYCRWATEKILTAMGCDPYSIRHTSPVLGHPSGSCPIGKVIDTNLETQIKNLFVCDVSSMPGAPSRPPVLTIVTLAKYFLPILLERI